MKLITWKPKFDWWTQTSGVFQFKFLGYPNAIECIIEFPPFGVKVGVYKQYKL